MNKNKLGMTKGSDERTFAFRALLLFCLLLLIAAGMIYTSLTLSNVTLQLLPRERSDLAWEMYANSDQQVGGLSSIEAKEGLSNFHFTFVVRPSKIRQPYVSFSVNFTEFFKPVSLADLSLYKTLSLNISCSPANTLNFTLYTFEEEVTKTEDFDSYRKSSTFFSCEPIPRKVDIDLTRLEAQKWWQLKYNVNFSKSDYQLAKTLSFALHNSPHSAANVVSEVKIDSADFVGRDWRSLYVALILCVVMCFLYLRWYLKGRTRILIASLSEKALQDRPLLAYQKLTSIQDSDDLNLKIMHFIATEYANPDLNLDMIVANLEVSRAKINEALKAEVGSTFVGHLNKIRLAEAARLLLEGEHNVSVIAYAVGYNNASYFNTLFKKEYGVTPKAFQKSMREDQLSSS